MTERLYRPSSGRSVQSRVRLRRRGPARLNTELDPTRVPWRAPATSGLSLHLRSRSQRNARTACGRAWPADRPESRR